MKSWILQTTIFAIIAALCALGTYWVKGEFDRRIPCDPSTLKENEVCLETVLNDWGGDVVWIDARKRDLVSESIKGALFISPENLGDDIEREGQKLFFAGQDGKKAVIFCASEHCGSSKTVQIEITKNKELHDDVYYLHGGWKAIEGEKALESKIEKLPTESR